MMARALARLALSSCVAAAGANSAEGDERALQQTWDNALDSGAAGGRDTPVTRVVNLLKEMSKTLSSEMDEDEALYNKLACWCSNNKYEKDAAIQASTAKVAELQSTIESQTARKAELKANLAELESSIADDKKSLAESTALREKQSAEFHKDETESIQNLEGLKAAITVLSKHHSAPPASMLAVAGGAIFKSEQDSWATSFVAVNAHGFPWRESSADQKVDNQLDDFMRNNGFEVQPSDIQQPLAGGHPKQKFLQQGSGALATDSASSSTEWSAADIAVVQSAMKSASSFVQAHHADGYYPAYAAQSGEIMGVLQQLKDEMEASLSDSQKQEVKRAEDFADLRSAKVAQIESQEKMAEQKEDELANAVNTVADAKEDLAKEEASLSEDQNFMKNLAKTCANADKDFAARKAARMEEIKAVSETIGILQEDGARDAMSGTFNFIQIAARKSNHEQHRRGAAEALRRTAKKLGDPVLSILATKVELDAFSRVKKAIDDMIAALKQQQKDEVKKTDWCQAEFHQNEMSIAKNTDEKAGHEAVLADLQSSVKALQDGIADAQARIAQLQLELQRASEVRKKENKDFQKTIADQTMTVEVLHKALNKLASYYDMMQVQAHAKRQTPPVPQMEYKKSKGSGGVMEMIEKLAYDAKELMAASKHSESESQAAYEQNIADTNGSVEALQKEIVSKTQAKGRTRKDLTSAQSDLEDTTKEIDGLAKYDSELHAECDYVVKNFDVRQSARSQEIEALQQAKQILSGASMS